MKKEKRIIFGLILSCWLVYTLSISMKMAYSSSISEIIDDYGISNTYASLPLTMYYIFYTIIQVMLTLFITKINLKRYLLITFTVSGLSFVSIYFYSPIWYISLILAVNGITLGAAWCSAVLIFVKYLSQKTLNRACLFMSAGFAVGGALSFGVSALSIYLGNWRISFLAFGVMFLISLGYEMYSLNRAEKAQLKPKDEQIVLKKQTYRIKKLKAKYLLILSIIAMFFVSFLYYGFNNWMPKILKDIFGLSNANSTLITASFPIIVYLGAILSVVFCNLLKDDFSVSLIFSIIVAIMSFILSYYYNLNIMLTIALIFMLGILLRLLINLFGVLTPLHILEYINSGKSSAIITSSASGAAAVSPAIISIILDLNGGEWGKGFLILFVFALVTVVICLIFFILYSMANRKKLTE